jgi:hypothetical protein
MDSADPATEAEAPADEAKSSWKLAARNEALR